MYFNMANVINLIFKNITRNHHNLQYRVLYSVIADLKLTSNTWLVDENKPTKFFSKIC